MGFCFISIGQTYQVKVQDGGGNPIKGTEVFIEEIDKTFYSNAQGSFTITGLTPGTYTVLAFSMAYQIFQEPVIFDPSKTITITLEPLGEELNEVIITQQRQKLFSLRRLKPVEGTAIYAGKKSEVVLLENIVGNIAANNPRQIYNQVVGLNIYEDCNAGLQLNIGGRGLNPNRSANFNIRQNGYDISADVLGYPESYYSPPPEALEEIQIVRGAASLQYGTQFGGLINFKFKEPDPTKEIELVTRQSIGSFGLFTSFNSLGGKVGDLSYYTYFSYKNGECFRCNSGFDSKNIFASLAYDFSKKTKLKLETTYMNYLAQQPGGISDAQFYEDPSFTNRARNWFKVDWLLYALQLEHIFSQQTKASLQFFGLDASRSAVGFRENRVNTVDDPNEQRELLVDNFVNWGAEARVITKYALKEIPATLLVGTKFYQTNNDQRQGPGSASAEPDFNFATEEFPNYPRQANFDFPNTNLAFFGENIFELSEKFSITPGFRFEYIKTESEGSFKNIVVDLAGNVLLNEEIDDSRSFERNFILLGLGFSYKPTSAVEFYANVSENYRSVTFSDIRITNPNFVIDENIEDESGYTADIGVRGKYENLFSYDVSAFGLFYNGRIGEIQREETRIDVNGNEIGTGRLIRFRSNIGDAFIYGFESLIDWNVKNTLLSNTPNLRLNLFNNLALTRSDYTSSDSNGVEDNRVEFIPQVNLKSGLNFGYKNFLGSLQYTYISEQFTDATNAPQDVNDSQSGIIGSIPAYDIMDLSFSYTYKKWRIETGINNLLDEVYFTRRATGYPGPGIIPSEPRTYYLTLQLTL
ncbi:TonB-dependent receptor [Gangjinia marincola]|uniref:TonB-dependent receptor n=2 Tax=Gangjinia marincola TaxID=578463 RepID=A0ABN1MJD1_9FLAO